MPVAVTPRREAGLLAAVFMLASWIWTMAVGKDVSWDVINHHLYLPFSWLTHRYSEDLFAASTQSYQNPLGYIPFYLLLKTSLPSWAIGSALALSQALVAVPLTRIALWIWPGQGDDRWWRLLAVALAWLAPIYLLTVGTSSVDPWSCLLVVTALALCLSPRPQLEGIVLAGLLSGLAFAIKPSNVVFSVALGGLLLLRTVLAQVRGTALPAHAAAAMVGVLIFMGPWSWWLWKTFGNPVFPLFNHWFGSPYAPQSPISAGRFLMEGPWDLLTRPAKLAAYQNYTHTEKFAPDIRPLALALVALPALWVALRTERWRGLMRSASAQLAAFTSLCYVLWLMTSGNSRYAVALFVVSALVLVRATQVLLPVRAARTALALVACLQVLYYGFDGDYRYMARPWDARAFLVVQVPKRLAEEPFLHLSVGTPSYAGLAMHLHPAGALANVVGTMSLPTDGALGEALQQRLTRWRGRTRVLFPGRSDWRASTAESEFRERADRVVYRFGLRFDWNDCEEIRVMRDIADPSLPGYQTGVLLLSCRALAREADDPHYDSERAAADRIFEVVERQCPRWFSPKPFVTDGDLKAWQRRYMNTDIRLTVSMSEGVMVSHFRSPNVVWLGMPADILAGKSNDFCAAVDKLGIMW